MKCALITLSVLSALVIAGALLAMSQFTLSALPEPGSIETSLATKARHILVRRGSREGIPPTQVNLPASIEEGDEPFGTECADCQGLDGHKPTDARWMYPRSRSQIKRDAAVSGSRIILDCEEWNSFERYARLWQGGDRRARLEFGQLCSDTARRTESSLKLRMGSAAARENRESPQPIRGMQNMVSKLVGPEHGKVVLEE